MGIKIKIESLEIEATPQEIEATLNALRGPTLLDHQQQQIDSFKEVVTPVLGVALGIMAFKMFPSDKFQAFAAMLGKYAGFDPAMVDTFTQGTPPASPVPKTDKNGACIDPNCPGCRAEGRKDVFEFLSKLTGKDQLMDQLRVLEKNPPAFEPNDYRPSELYVYAVAIKRYPSLLDMLFDQGEWTRGELYAGLTATAAHNLYNALSVDLIGCPPAVPPLPAAAAPAPEADPAWETASPLTYDPNAMYRLIKALRYIFGKGVEAPFDETQMLTVLNRVVGASRNMTYAYPAEDEAYLREYFATGPEPFIDDVISDLCKIMEPVISWQPKIRVGVHAWDDVKRGLLVVFPFLNG